MGSAAGSHARAIISAGINLDYLLRVASSHGVLPLICRNILKYFPELLSEDERRQLKRTFLLCSVRNKFLWQRLLSILDRLEENGISAMPLKGPSLALRVYGDLALRQFADLDILVRQEDVGRTIVVLESLDFEVVADPVCRFRFDKDLSNDTERHIVLAHRAGVFVELHWEIGYRYLSGRFSSELLWEGCRSTLVGSQRMLIPAPDNELLFLTVHACSHTWRRLLWICDVASFMRAHEHLDLNQLVRDAHNLGCGKMLIVGFMLAADLFGAPSTERLAEHRKTHRHLELLSKEIRRGLFKIRSVASERVYRTWFDLRVMQGHGNRAKYLLFLMRKPAPKYPILDLPFSSSAFLFVTRLIRLVGLSVGRIVRRVV